MELTQSWGSVSSRQGRLCFSLRSCIGLGTIEDDFSVSQMICSVDMCACAF